MSIERTWQIEPISLEATLDLAEEIGSRLKGGEIIVLAGDLGAGKTTFVRGLAHGMGSKDHVNSPSFTLSHQYKADGLTLHHFDFYRLPEPGIIREALAEVLAEAHNVTVIEWADIMHDVLPPDYLTIHIAPKDETTRTMTFDYPEQLQYLLPANT